VSNQDNSTVTERESYGLVQHVLWSQSSSSRLLSDDLFKIAHGAAVAAKNPVYRGRSENDGAGIGTRRSQQGALVWIGAPRSMKMGTAAGPASGTCSVAGYRRWPTAPLLFGGDAIGFQVKLSLAVRHSARNAWSHSAVGTSTARCAKSACSPSFNSNSAW
jgi:hypothetical protein